MPSTVYTSALEIVFPCCYRSKTHLRFFLKPSSSSCKSSPSSAATATGCTTAGTTRQSPFPGSLSPSWTAIAALITAAQENLRKSENCSYWWWQVEISFSDRLLNRFAVIRQRTTKWTDVFTQFKIFLHRSAAF